VKRRAPAAPENILKATRDLWNEFWGSRLSAIVNPGTDLPALRRLFTLYDERERTYRAVKRERLVKGSQGQPVLNPLYRNLGTLDSEIRQLEDRFGLSPISRLRLGITFGEAQRSLEEMNRALDADDDEDPTEEDPRLEAAASADARTSGVPVDRAKPRPRRR
jgi:P27 family predicted phage terminase small subunit